ncbi:hypothetical protein C2845_PM13G24690 [Panicum miliaceum]|uniref:Uncharacterized protein n=1 Tax=Panicum miliaceum TaxID=4540 RepID=A0A3L6RLL4_PANMI|nr:hypothetical protein C2845_PM13G24690 [Panicum miliaceum]
MCSLWPNIIETMQEGRWRRITVPWTSNGSIREKSRTCCSVQETRCQSYYFYLVDDPFADRSLTPSSRHGRWPPAAVMGGAGSRGRPLHRRSPPPIPRPCILPSAVAKLPLAWRSRATATASAAQGHRHRLRAPTRLPVAAAAKPDPPQLHKIRGSFRFATLNFVP